MKTKLPFLRGVTSIQMTRETKAKLAEAGKKDDTYEDIIKRLLSSQASPKRGEVIVPESPT